MPARHDPLPRVVRRILTKKERVLSSTRRHWAWLLGPAATLLAGTLLAVWFSSSFPDTAPLPNLLWLAWLLLVARTLWRCFVWTRNSFVVTSERFLLVTGNLTLTIAQLPLAFGKDITLRQSLLGQRLGYGEFVLETAPKDHLLRDVTWVPDCERLHRRISLLMQGDGLDSDGYTDVVVPGYDDNRIVFVDESSRSAPERVERAAGAGLPGVSTGTRGPGLLSLWRGVRSTLPSREHPQEGTGRRVRGLPIPRIPWRRRHHKQAGDSTPARPAGARQSSLPNVIRRL
ncbi:MAG: PH domain-containing protein [Actinomycetales bacterium]